MMDAGPAVVLRPATIDRKSRWSLLELLLHLRLCGRVRNRTIGILGLTMTIFGLAIIILQAVNSSVEAHLHYVAAGFWAGAWMMVNGGIGAIVSISQRKGMNKLFVILSATTASVVAAPLIGISIAAAVTDGVGNVVSEGDNYLVLQDNAAEYQSYYNNCTIEEDLIESGHRSNQQPVFKVVCTNSVGFWLNVALSSFGLAFFFLSIAASIFAYRNPPFGQSKMAAAKGEQISDALSWMPLEILERNLGNTFKSHKKTKAASSFEANPHFADDPAEFHKLQSQTHRRLLKAAKNYVSKLSVHKRIQVHSAYSRNNLTVRYSTNKSKSTGDMVNGTVIDLNSSAPNLAYFADPLWALSNHLSDATPQLPTPNTARRNGSFYHIPGDNY